MKILSDPFYGNRIVSNTWAVKYFFQGLWMFKRTLSFQAQMPMARENILRHPQGCKMGKQNIFHGKGIH